MFSGLDESPITKTRLWCVVTGHSELLEDAVPAIFVDERVALLYLFREVTRNAVGREACDATQERLGLAGMTAEQLRDLLDELRLNKGHVLHRGLLTHTGEQRVIITLANVPEPKLAGYLKAGHFRPPLPGR